MIIIVDWHLIIILVAIKRLTKYFNILLDAINYYKMFKQLETLKTGSLDIRLKIHGLQDFLVKTVTYILIKNYRLSQYKLLSGLVK